MKVSDPTKYIFDQHRSGGLGQPGHSDEFREFVDAHSQLKVEFKGEESRTVCMLATECSDAEVSLRVWFFSRVLGRSNPELDGRRVRTKPECQWCSSHKKLHEQHTHIPKRSPRTETLTVAVEDGEMYVADESEQS